MKTDDSVYDTSAVCGQEIVNFGSGWSGTLSDGTKFFFSDNKLTGALKL